ncbi:MAG TPA: nitroreductase [Coriobacteriia bacterium]
MQVSHAIRERRSARAFLAEPVDADTVSQIIDLAKWSPSWANTQGWNVYVVTGEPLARIKAALADKAANGRPATPDIPMPSVWPDYLRARMNMQRPPSEVPGAEGPRPTGPSIWDLYGAPCLVVLAVDAHVQPAYACFDAGLFAQTFCLAAEDRGFSTCIMAMAVRYSEIVHAEIPDAEGKRFVVGIALGVIDHTAVINRAERNRVELEEIATFIGD